MLKAVTVYRYVCDSCGGFLTPPHETRGAAVLALAAVVQQDGAHAVGSSDLTRCRLGCLRCGPPKKGDS